MLAQVSSHSLARSGLSKYLIGKKVSLFNTTVIRKKDARRQMWKNNKFVSLALERFLTGKNAV